MPVTGPGAKLAVFCITTERTAAVDRWQGGSWHGWHSVGASPSGLTANPAVVTDAAGQTELFAATRSGGLDYAWRAAGTGSWTWGTPLAGGSTGQQIRRTPAAVRWPDGLVRVYAQLASGQLGVIGQQGTAGAAAWSGWTPIGDSVLGSPAAWISASGIPAAGGIDATLRMGSTSFAGGVERMDRLRRQLLSRSLAARTAGRPTRAARPAAQLGPGPVSCDPAARSRPTA